MINLWQKNRNLVLIGIAVLALLILGGGYYLSQSKGANQNQVTGDLRPEEEVIPAISPEELGFTLSMSKDGKKVVLEVLKTEDLSVVDYELSYTSEDDIPRGAIGHIEVKTPGKAISQEIVLGTCSDVCHYDKDVSDIKLILKVTKADGKVYQSEQAL